MAIDHGSEAGKAIIMADADHQAVEGLVKRYGADTLVAATKRLQDLHRAQTREEIDEAERKAVFKRFTGLYTRAGASLDAFGISRKDAPSWGEVAQKVTPDIVALARLLKSPRLLLVPPIGAFGLIKLINEQVTYDRFNQLSSAEKKFGLNSKITANYEDADGDSCYSWDVCLVEGDRNIEVIPELQQENGVALRNDKQINALLDHYGDSGFNMMSAQRHYLALVMQALLAGEPIDDEGTITVLQRSYIEEEPTANDIFHFGTWNENSIYFGRCNLDGFDTELCGRAIRYLI